MDFKKGMVVISRAGRDSGYPMAVVDVKDGFVFVCDGKERPLERPKKKNPLHLAATNKTIQLDNITNRKLRTVLREHIAEESE